MQVTIHQMRIVVPRDVKFAGKPLYARDIAFFCMSSLYNHPNAKIKREFRTFQDYQLREIINRLEKRRLEDPQFKVEIDCIAAIIDYIRKSQIVASKN